MMTNRLLNAGLQCRPINARVLRCLVVVLIPSLVILYPADASLIQTDRPAEEILADLDGVKLPTYDRERNKNEPNYRNEYFASRRDANLRKARLILELWQSHPKHDRLPALLAERWKTLVSDANEPTQALKETNEVLRSSRRGSDHAREAMYARAQILIRQTNSPDTVARQAARDGVEEAIQQFVDGFPKDSRAPRLFATLADRFAEDDEKAIEIWNHLLTTYPDNSGAKYWPGKIRQLEGISEPFLLEFTDAITDSQISMRDLQGQVVVIDFWATWCGPCIAEMPKMKKLYTKYRDQGVEFIGVSLDHPESQGGLARLREYCKENEITWPQYFQGNHWSSEFSVSWGINSIPAVFIVDQQGNLYSTDARGHLETLIPKLLELRK